MQVDFPHTKAESVTLSNPGDYVFFAPGVCHTWKANQKTTVISVRWPSIPGDQVPCDHADY
jgi:quercetin dioxygenase-like cupin family protein